MEQYPVDEFDVDLFERRVIHKPSGIWFSFYEYQNESDWQQTDNAIFRDNPDWPGDRLALAAAAKRAALARGMTARRPASSKNLAKEAMRGGT
jgi:hypothetical protein